MQEHKKTPPPGVFFFISSYEVGLTMPLACAAWEALIA